MDSESEPIRMHLLRDHTVNALKSRALHKQLLDSLSSKDFRSFKSLVDQNLNRQSTDIDINYVDPNESGQTYLEIACKDGLEDFAKFLLERGAKINRINQVYNRGPIHFATENGHTGVLGVLLDEPTINPNLEAGQQTALHVAVRRNDWKAAELLLDKGASPNIPNNKGLTALHAAAMKGNRDMVERIMRKSRHALCLDKYKDYNDQTTRDVLREKMPEIPLPPVQATDVNVHDLKYYLNANDESNFLKCMEVVQNDVVKNQLEDLIEMAVQRNFKDAVYGLLGRAEGVVGNLERAANIAIERGLPDILDRILKANGGNMDRTNVSGFLLNACIELGVPGTEDSQIASDRLECLKLILRRDDVDVRCTDSKGNTPLHYAARADCREAVTLLLEKGSYIGHMNNLGVPPVAHISESTLSRYLDTCIDSKKSRANEYTIELNYKSFIPCLEKREMDVFQYIADNNGLKYLLNHPLLSLFLYLKWRRIRSILFVYSIFYFFLWLLLVAYIVLATYKNIDTKASTNSTGRVMNEEAIESGVLDSLRILTAVTLTFLFLIEIVQLIFSFRYYMSNAGNCLKIILIIFGFWMLWGAEVEVKVLVVLLSAWEMVIMIGQYPWMSTDIEIFKKVSVNFIRFLFLYAFLILAFAVAFFLLFKKPENDDNFPDLEHSLFKTIIMLTGEFDANDIPFLLHPVQSRLVFVLFVFIIVIVLFNLLNGLAVSDTADILAKAKLVGLITKIRFIAYVENFPQFRTWNPFAVLIGEERILLFPTFFQTGKLTIPYDPLRDSFVYKANDNKWLDDHFKNKVFLDIMKEINEVLSKRNKELHSEKMISVMEKINERLALIEINLNDLKRVIENNNFNVRNNDQHNST